MVIIKKPQKGRFWISMNLLAKLQSLQKLQSAKDVTLGSEGHIKAVEVLPPFYKAGLIGKWG